MKTSFFIFMGIAICGGSIAAAGPKPEPVPQKLDLTHAEALALRYAPQISEAYFRAQALGEVIGEARSGLFPQITGIVTAVGTGPDIARAFGSGGAESTQTTRLGATGGINNPSVYSRESNGLMITQLITDFGRTADLISAARYESLSYEQRTRLARAQVILLVDESYFKVLGAQELLRVANETVAARQLTYDRVKALADSKLKSELDLSFAKVDLENAQLLVLQTQNALDEAQADLSAALGYHEEHHFVLEQEPQYAFPKDDIHVLIAQALQYRPEVVALRDEQSSAAKFAEAQGAARYPTVSAMGSLGRTPVGNENVYGNYSAAGIVVSVPIFTGGMLTARFKEADYKARAAAKAVEEMEDVVVRDVREAWLNAASAQKKIQVTDELLASTSQEFELAESRYKLGVISIIELSQAQLSKTQAEINFASAKYEYQIDRVKLEFETGALKYRTPGIILH